MTNITSVLKHFGLSDKEIKVYLTCLGLGPQPVRKIAYDTKISRGTCYDILKNLINLGLVSYYLKDKNKYFIAENPIKLKEVLKDKKRNLERVEDELSQIIPELESIYDDAGPKPKVKFYEGFKGVKTVLLDLLETLEKFKDNKEYYVYSAANIRKYLYKDFPHFTKERIKRGIRVKVLAIGSGGSRRGLDERKWISKRNFVHFPTYTLIYADRLAMISVNSEGRPISIIIEDKGIAQTQKFLFEYIWESI